MEWVVVIVVVVLVLLLGDRIGLRLLARRPHREADARTEESAPERDSHAAKVYAAAESMSAFFDQAAHPRDLLENEYFDEGVSVLADLAQEDILGYAFGANVTIACMAFEALRRKPGDEEALDRALQRIGDIWGWPLFFALRFVQLRSDSGLAGQIVARASDWWADVPFVREFLRTFLEELTAKGHAVDFGAELENIPSERLAAVEQLLDRLGPSVAGDLMRSLAAWRLTHLDAKTLKGVGRVWVEADTATIIMHGELSDDVMSALSALRRTDPRSVLIAGPSGVGKTELVRVVCSELQKDGWTVFEAGSTELLAGTMFIGSLEERIRELVEALNPDRKVLWYIPAFHEMLYAGRHQYNPQGVLDRILPFIESGNVLVIGETRSESLERLLEARPRLRSSVDVIRVEPTDDESTMDLSRRWARSILSEESARRLGEEVLAEAHHLSKQYLSDRSAPGNLLEFLKITHARVSADGTLDRPIGIDDLLVTLSQLSGLPLGILDDRKALSLDALRDLFGNRVLGQPEAAECLIERVALIKAGLTDPSRPYGVFLFVGPTGTGKTEIAKALAEFLFGSPHRMIRLDMSEFKTPASLDRILGPANPSPGESGTALVNAIRQQPFSVVLLDEFEKAHRQVWDLFLQVFDDGRLTDRNGNAVDFRHAIIILTSNLGAAIPRASAMGFGESSGPGMSDRIMQETGRTFSPEFLNRIDRTVIFRPLSRSTMREILKKELRAVLDRRGFRGREWAVEWDAAAVDFLLDMGFTRDLGARPLKRAIERYLLSPLALTIATHQYPAGNQFLFVRRDDDALHVEFVDPDAPTEHPEPPAHTDDGDIRLRSTALSPSGTREELDMLAGRYEKLHRTVGHPDWEARKSGLLLQMGDPDFWQSNLRFAVLSEIELMDRLEAGFETASSLMDRLQGTAPGNGRRLPIDMVRRLAQQIYLLETACIGREAGLPHACFVRVAAGEGTMHLSEAAENFRRQLVSMYLKWGSKRRMTVRHLKMPNGDVQRADIIGVSGFGAFSILEAERGLHVLEVPAGERSTQRISVPVAVAPSPEAWPDADDDLLDEANRAFEVDDGSTARVARRYRELPSPLVRDTVRGWRTGLLERVLDGDFDLIC